MTLWVLTKREEKQKEQERRARKFINVPEDKANLLKWAWLVELTST